MLKEAGRKSGMIQENFFMNKIKSAFAILSIV